MGECIGFHQDSLPSTIERWHDARIDAFKRSGSIVVALDGTMDDTNLHFQAAITRRRRDKFLEPAHACSKPEAE